MRKSGALRFLFSIIVFSWFFALSAGSHAIAEDSVLEPQSLKQQADPVLKERERFNQLKRSTRNIYKVTMRPGVAFKLQTAVGFVSTIDLPEKALKVFVGDQDLFKVEVYERQVLVKPLTDELDARTNLIIVTRTNRLAFDICVGTPETADFVLDFRLPRDDEALVKNAFEEKVEEQKTKLQSEYQKKEEALDQKARAISEEKIKERVASGLRTLPLRKSEAQGEIQVNLLTLAQVADKAYLRFSILNYSKRPYRVASIFLGFQIYEKKLIGKRESGVVEIPCELKLAPAIKPDGYEYGVLEFDWRALGKDEKPIFKISEDVSGQSPFNGEARNIEIKGFDWFK